MFVAKNNYEIKLAFFESLLLNIFEFDFQDLFNVSLLWHHTLLST